MFITRALCQPYAADTRCCLWFCHATAPLCVTPRCCHFSIIYIMVTSFMLFSLMPAAFRRHTLRHKIRHATENNMNNENTTPRHNVINAPCYDATRIRCCHTMFSLIISPCHAAMPCCFVTPPLRFHAAVSLRDAMACLCCFAAACATCSFRFSLPRHYYIAAY